MNVVVVCPTTVHIVFVPAEGRDSSMPQLPFTCPSCAATVAHIGDHPRGPSIQDLIDFPHPLCGTGEVWLGKLS